MWWVPAAVIGVSLIALAASQPVSELRTVAMVPMRDGIRLSTNIFQPPGTKRTPVLLIRTPYGKGKDLVPTYRVFIENGYTVVVQDVRGRYDSEGIFRPLTQEEPDGNDTLNWIARQSWCDGNIGMLGGSYVGIVQWKAALTGNRHLKAIFPLVAGYDEYLDRFYSRGGALKLGHRLLWLAENLRPATMQRADFRVFVRQVPVRNADEAATGRNIDFFDEALNHPSYDEFWRARSTRARIDRVQAPAFIVTGWYDNFAQSDLEAFTELSKRSRANRVVVGPWAHNMSIPFEGISFGPDAGASIRRYQLEWFNYWLRTPHPAHEFAHPPVRIFVMGANRWREEREWPLSRTRFTPMYLTSGSGAATANGDGVLSTEPRRTHRDEFTYDPRNPTLTFGGPVCCNPKIFPWGPMDQREVEKRPDVLVYSTPPLIQEIEVTGVVRSVLFVSSSAPDTDFTAKLVDVFPDGHARNLTDGILRLRYRNGLEKPEIGKPGEIYRIVIDAGITSNVFRAGHRLRLEVSSSNFPRFDRNPNTGRAIADEQELRTARQTVYHGRRYPSHVLLPVIP